MATFTIALKRVMKSTPNIGLNEYPIFDEAYREGLNKKITDHYHNQEIGMESVDMFIFAMSRKMNEIMPYYNQMYKSQLLDINPLLTFRSVANNTSTMDGSATNYGTSTAANESGSDSASHALNSNYPQTQLVDDEQYADTGAESTANTTATGSATSEDNGTNTNTQDATGQNTSEGFASSMSTLLLQYRETFLNIDLAIIAELSSLFMLIWDNGDNYTNSSYMSPVLGFYRGGF